ncbi:MAG: hypothetical protein IIU11_03595 [Bacteroidales bacterium]|nr:hypothetical protein [Bacteroidales bacterium]
MSFLKKFIFPFMGVLCCVLSLCVGCEDDEDKTDNAVLRAVPTDAGVIIRTQNITAIADILSKDNIMWRELSKLKMMKQADGIIRTADSVFMQSPELRALLRDKQSALSFHKIGKDKVYALAAVEISKVEAGKIAGIIAKTAKTYNLECKRTPYDKSEIFIVSDNSGIGKLFFSYHNGIMMFSSSKLMAETAIRNTKTNANGIGKNPILKKLLKTAGKNVNAFMIINYSNLCDMLKPELNSQKFSGSMANFAQWSVLDISVDKKNAIGSGYTCGKGDCENFIGIFSGQKPLGNNFIKTLPSKTTHFVSIGISDMSAFKNDFSDYLKSKDAFSSLQKSNENIRETFGVNIYENIYTMFSGRITEFTCDYSFASRGYDNYIMIETDDASKAENFLRKISLKYQKNTNTPDEKIIFEVPSISGKKIKAYFFPVKKLLPMYFGNVFSGEYCYFAALKNKIVFFQSVSSLKEYIDAIDNGKTLADNSNYNSFSELVYSQSNIFCYLDPAYSPDLVLSYLNKENSEAYKKEKNNLKNFRGLAVQYVNNDNGMFYTNIPLMYSQIIEAERSVSWLAHVDTVVRSKPQLVKNHITGEKEIFVQDETGKIYLFTKNGERLWKKQLPEPISGEVTQIDYFQNGKLQYLFATGGFLHLIDRNGNYVENFPVALPSRLSADISVFDYENNGNYRIFAPCSDKRLYVYTKEGKQLETWNPFVTKESIITPVQYFNINTTEYLIFSDNLKTYILNRRGEPRIYVTNNFPKARNSRFFVEAPGGIENSRFVTTNSSGGVEYIRLDGSCKQLNIKHYSANHHFVCADINSDGENEYIFSDENILEVFTSNGKLLFNYFFDTPVTTKPLIFNFADGKKIGVACAEENKLYLFDSKGNICNGFPINGSTEFSITSLNNQGKYNVLTGSQENYLYNFFIR